MCGVYYSIMRTTHPDLVCLLCVPSLYSTFEFLIYLLYYVYMCLCVAHFKMRMHTLQANIKPAHCKIKGTLTRIHACIYNVYAEEQLQHNARVSYNTVQ